MFKKFVERLKNLLARIKRAAKAAVVAFKEDPEKTSEPEVIDVTVNEDESVFKKAADKAKEFVTWATEHPLDFSIKLGVITTILSIPVKALSAMGLGTFKTFRAAAEAKERRTRFYDYNRPGTFYYTKRPMTKREQNYYSSQRDDGRHTPDILREMGLLIA